MAVVVAVEMIAEGDAAVVDVAHSWMELASAAEPVAAGVVEGGST